MNLRTDSDSPETHLDEHLLPPLEVRPSKEDWPIFIILGVALFAFTAVILPYRNIQIPRIAMFATGACLSLVLIPILMEWHHSVLLLLLTYLPFNKVLPGTFGRLAPAFNMTNILLLMTIAGWIMYSTKTEEPLMRRQKADVPLAVFMFLASLSLIRGFMLVGNQDPVEEIFSLKRWLTPMVMYFIVVNCVRNLRLAFLSFLTICLNTGVLSVICIKKFYMDIGVRSSIEKMRLEVTSGPNHLGFMMSTCVFLFVAVWWVFRHRDKRYWFLWIPILLCIQTMRLTFSRGAQVGLVAGGMMFAYYANKRIFALLCVLGVIVAVNPSIVPDRVSGRMSNTIVREEGTWVERLDKSSQTRVYVWDAGLRMALDYPLLGVGYGNFKERVGSYNRKISGVDAHNTYVIVAAEMGFPALFCFLWFFVVGFRSARNVLRNASRDPFLRCIGLGYMGLWASAMVGNMFGTRFDSVEVSFQVFSLTSLVVICDRMIRDREATKTSAAKPFRPLGGMRLTEASDAAELPGTKSSSPKAERPDTFADKSSPPPPGTPLREWRRYAENVAKAKRPGRGNE